AAYSVSADGPGVHADRERDPHLHAATRGLLTSELRAHEDAGPARERDTLQAVGAEHLLEAPSVVQVDRGTVRRVHDVEDLVGAPGDPSQPCLGQRDGDAATAPLGVDGDAAEVVAGRCGVLRVGVMVRLRPADHRAAAGLLGHEYAALGVRDGTAPGLAVGDAARCLLDAGDRVEVGGGRGSHADGDEGVGRGAGAAATGLVLRELAHRTSVVLGPKGVVGGL